MLLGISGAEGTGPITRTGSHTNVPDQCVHCHMPDARHTFTVSLDISCAPCHTADDAASREQTLQGTTLNGLLALRTRMRAWAQTTFGNPDLWNYPANLPVGTTAPAQSSIPIQIKRARHNYYYILLDRSYGVHNAFYTQYLLTYSNQNLDDLGVSAAVAHATYAVPQLKSMVQSDIKTAMASASQPDASGN